MASSTSLPPRERRSTVAPPAARRRGRLVPAVRAEWPSLALAVLAGAVLTLAFPPYGAWLVAPLVVALLTLLAHRRSAGHGALLGLAAGLGFFVPLLHWTGIYVGPVPWLLLAGVQAAYFVPLGAATALATRVAGWPLWVACLWVAQEALRMRWPWGGFPWGRLAFSQADAPTLGLAALGGAPLVTLAVALAGTLLAAAVLALSRRGRAGAGRAVAALAAASAVTVAGLFVPAPAPDGGTVTVAVVQGNVPEPGLDFNAERRAVLRNHARATEALAARVAAGEVDQPDLVVWPENSSDIDPYRDAEARSIISDAVDAVGVPVLVGAVVGVDERTVENTGIVWTPGEGPGQAYVKRHPVPFAEYIPLRSVARLVSSEVDRVARDFVPGDRPGVLNVGPVTLGDVICFEVGYDGVVRDVVAGGAELLAVQTNNATFGFTPQTEQQLVMSRLRAVEHARATLVAATSGVSAVIDPDGSVRTRSELFTAETFVEPVQLSTARTTASRIGAWPEALAVLAGLAAAALGGRRPAGTSGRRGGNGPGDTREEER